MREGTIEYVRLSNDRPNIHYAVEDMRFSAKSMLDLDRVFKIDPSIPPPKFMIFTNKQKECEQVAKKYQDELPPKHWDKIIWFHSEMSKEFKEAAMEKLRKGEIWGIVCTDAAGMVSLVFLPSGSVRLTSNRA
jgi:superfamily II DNA/RNA helicase